PTSAVVTRRLAKPRPVQGEAGSDDAARRGTGYAARAAGQPVAERDGHPRQNPAYRPATEKALAIGAFSMIPIRRRLVRLAPAGATAVSVEPLGTVAHLDDSSPARLLREGDIDEEGPEVIAAERAFLVGG